MLLLRMLGGASVCRLGPSASEPVEVMLPRRALALLALVAVAGRDGLSRDKVLVYLWPESDQERGRNALRQTLHTLRRDLETPDLLSGADILRLNQDLASSDVLDFEVALGAGAWEKAAVTYRGPFLDGFHVGHAPDFERWLDERRSSLASQAQTAIEKLAVDADRRGDADSAVVWWRRLGTLDPLNARTAVGLMRALVSAGNPSGALQYAGIYELMVKEELDAAPDAAVTSLAHRIRSGIGQEQAGSPPSGVAQVRSPAGTPGAGSLLERLQANLESRYRIDRELERGGSGQTRSVLAFDRRHDRPVVLKVLHPSLASQIDTARFIREIRFTAGLRHPHFLPLLDSGELDGRLWYTVPYVGGETLRNRITRDGTIPVHEAVRIVSQVAGAADHAHRNGVIHRDITPENVVLAEGHAILTNLGLSRALGVAAAPKLTESGAIVGTPAYMSPEQAEGDSDLDGRSDLFSLGCILYELITGEPLYSGPTPQSIMAKRKIDPRPLVRGVPHVPERVKEALLKALALTRERRFASTAEFADALLQDLPETATRGSRAASLWNRVWGKSGALLWAAAGVLALLVLLRALRHA